MKRFPTIYSKDSTGKIRIWFQEQDGANYRTVAGVKDSENLVTSDWTVAQGKNVGKSNETSGEQQATLEIEAKYKKQLKDGYFKSIEDVDQIQYIEPMLAKRLSEREDKVTFPAMLDRKYNGGRVIGRKEGLFSRKGEAWLTIPHIFESIKGLFEKYPNLVTDGEAYNHEYRFKLNELMSILKRTKHITQEHLDRSREIIRYYIYDGYGFGNVTKQTGCRERREALKKLFAGYEFIVVVDYEVVNDLEGLYKVYQSFVDDGYEGAMYRTMNAPYVNKRSSDLLKVKPEDDSEGVIVAVHEGEGNWSGAAAKATIKWKDKEFDAPFKGTYEARQVILQEKSKWVGKEVTFLYNGLTGYGVPNFARIDIDNCFKK